MRAMSLTTRVLIALVLGLALGIAVSVSGSPALAAAARAIEPLGTLFINAIRIVVVPLLFPLAPSRLTPERREPLVGFFRAVADASLVLVRWVLVTAPVGVFALALPLAARLGMAAAGAVASYVVVTAVATTAFTLL